MTRYLLERPHTLVPLTFFADRYELAKSSISEDLTILKRTFQNRGTGLLETILALLAYEVFAVYLKEEAQEVVNQLIAEMSSDARYLPGATFICLIYWAVRPRCDKLAEFLRPNI